MYSAQKGRHAVTEQPRKRPLLASTASGPARGGGVYSGGLLTPTQETQLDSLHTRHIPDLFQHSEQP